jgi:hypothetical protein
MIDSLAPSYLWGHCALTVWNVWGRFVHRF